MIEFWSEEVKAKELQEQLNRVNRTMWKFEREPADRRKNGWCKGVTLNVWRLSLRLELQKK